MVSTRKFVFQARHCELFKSWRWRYSISMYFTESLVVPKDSEAGRSLSTRRELADIYWSIQYFAMLNSAIILMGGCPRPYQIHHRTVVVCFPCFKKNIHSYYWL